MVRADVMRMIITCGVVAIILSVPQLPLRSAPHGYIFGLAALAMMLGTAEVLRDNAAQTVLPSIVAKSDLEAANGQLWSIEEIMGSFVGPPLAGVLIAVAVPIPFVFDAVTFALAAWLVWLIALPPRIAPPHGKILDDIAAGWAWMRANPVILRLAIMLGLINALGMMVMSLLVLFSQDILGLTAVEHGLLLTAGAAGGVIGGFCGPWIVARFGGQTSVYAALLVMTVPFIAIAATQAAWVCAMALLVGTFGGVLWNVVTVSYRQRRIPDDVLGRVNSIYRFFGWGMMPVGILAGGVIVSAAEPNIGRDAALRVPIMISAIGHGAMFWYAMIALQLETSD